VKFEDFKKQLSRLTMFGNLTDQKHAEDYHNALSHLSDNALDSGIFWLISNHKQHYFPLPSDIDSAAKIAIADQKRRKSISYQYEPEPRFLHDLINEILHTVWLIPDFAIRQHILEMAQIPDGKVSTEEKKLIFETALEKLKSELKRLQIKIPKGYRGFLDTVINKAPDAPEENVGF